MQRAGKRWGKVFGGCALAVALCGGGLPVPACTIFVLTDTNRTLFCNNEDFSNPKTRIWFVPAGENYYGCVYVGFDDGFAQGGMNTQGLASDWVMGTSEAWNPDPSLPVSAGNRQLLETCATVEEAIAFFRRHRELCFYTSRILVVDRTGASVIIGAKGERLRVEKSHQSRGFGFGGKTLGLMLKIGLNKPTLTNGTYLLRACRQNGQFGTKYSNIFDLASGDIFLFSSPGRDGPVQFNLAKELQKGAHYYDIPQIRRQLTEAPRPLLANMERNLLDKCRPIPDQEPEVTSRVRAIWQDWLNNRMCLGDYTSEAWDEVSINRKLYDPMIRSLGDMVSMTLVDRTEDAGRRCYGYRIELERATLLQLFAFDTQGKVVACRTEDFR